MLKQQFEAQDDLIELSKQTQYIFDWSNNKPLHLKQFQRQKNTINEEQNQDQQVEKIKILKKPLIKRQTSESYDLKKWEKRKQTINKIEFPLLNDKPYVSEQRYITPKIKSVQIKELPINNIFKKRESSRKSIYRIIQTEFVKMKLQQFQKKNLESQKDLVKRTSHSKSKKAPKTLNIKKGLKSASKSPLDRHEANQQQILQIKKIIKKSERRQSVPHFQRLFIDNIRNESQFNQKI